MWMVIVCVFGVSATSVGEEKRELLSVDRTTFGLVRYEESNELKRQICDQRFGRVPDLAWIEVASESEILKHARSAHADEKIEGLGSTLY